MEQMTRVFVHLVCKLNSDRHIEACLRIIGHLRQLREQESVRRITGFTTTPVNAKSDNRPLGNWWSDEKNAWDREHVVIVTIDLMFDESDFERMQQEALNELKLAIFKEYKQSLIPQEEIWMVAHTITRCTGPMSDLQCDTCGLEMTVHGIHLRPHKTESGATCPGSEAKELKLTWI